MQGERRSSDYMHVWEPQPQVCPECGDEFQPTTKWHKFCCSLCHDTKWNREKRKTPEVSEVRRRLTHAEQILARLYRGPATSRELSAISLKYTGRVSDLRKLGHHIVAQRVAGGAHMYELRPPVVSEQRELFKGAA